MIAILTFVRKTQDGLHFIGVKDPANIKDFHISSYISGQPICVVIDNNLISSLYLINNEGQLFQIYGKNDNLFDLNEIYDITLINIEKYNTMKNFLINSYCKFTLSELDKYENNLTELENQIFSNLLHAELNIDKLKNQMIRISKKVLNEAISKKFEANLISCKSVSKKLIKKKIDIDLSNYNIKIKTNLN